MFIYLQVNGFSSKNVHCFVLSYFTAVFLTFRVFWTTIHIYNKEINTTDKGGLDDDLLPHKVGAQRILQLR